VEVSVEELVRVRDSGDTGPAPAPRRQQQSDRQYKRDKDGQFNEVDERGSKSGRTSDRRRRPMTAHERHVAHVKHVKRVKALQQLLNKLGYKVTVDGKLGPETKKIVNDLQRKLGLPLTDKMVDGRLMRRLRDVEILSPCAKGAKRSKEMDELDELIRAVMVDDECDCEDKDECDCGMEHDDDDEDSDAASYRSRPFADEILRYDRMWALDDIVVRSGGDGRTVEAYAAVFDVPTEIKDQHGHYMEVISRSAFNRAISHGIDRIGVFYHHGMTLAGTPSDLGSVPIGSPLEVRPDGRGLRTVSRFNRSALADSVLEAIRAGDIKGYSFRGKIYQSDPKRVPRGRGLATITRTELGLSEYGPTPTPYYADAGIVAVRSPQAIAEQLTTLDEPFRRELITILSRSTPQDPEREDATSTEEPGAEDPPAEALRSASMEDIRRRIAVFKILGGKK
jgi:HK97 family phage prohead protease